MKKALILGAAVAAMSISSAASALDIVGIRDATIRSEIGDIGIVFRVVTLPLASGSANYCHYRMLWENPFNPAQTVYCDLNEARTLGASNCSTNRNEFVTSHIFAGQEAPLSAASTCHGYNDLGDELDEVSLFLDESSSGTLSGVMWSPETDFLTVEIS